MDDPAFRREHCTGLWAELQPLLEAHYLEISSNLDIALDPIHELYETIEREGKLRLFTVRDHGRLIGYACYVVAPHPHYRGSLVATQDVVFLSAAWRRGRLGIRLLKFADAELKAEGVQVVIHHVKVAHPALGRVLDRLGYAETERIYTKRLDRE